EHLAFIVGMPRSGTSLAEQIIAAHPRALACGELIGMEVVEQGWGQAGLHPYLADGPQAVDSARLAEGRRQYLAGLPDGHGGHAVVTDKAPMNFLRVGQIHRMFPRARIVHCVRHPLDTIVSCWMQNFHAGLNFTHDLDDLARLYIAHDRLVAHWKEWLPERIHTLRYESVVSDQQAQTEALAGFLGLEFDAAMLAPHEAKHAVSTASAWQVRRPVYASSIGRWKAYEEFLQPQIERLQAAGVLDTDGEPADRSE
ncbi:MAG: sulfotransferase, partial [Xanthomonadales bacterium]|nr:sulfotransferase [Xanthomonadales bacterium]